MRGFPDFRSSILDTACQSRILHQVQGQHRRPWMGMADICVLILSNGVTAISDSVKPAPKPARTVRGPEILPFSSWRNVFILSKATNPLQRLQCKHNATCLNYRGQLRTHGFLPWTNSQWLTRYIQHTIEDQISAMAVSFHQVICDWVASVFWRLRHPGQFLKKGMERHCRTFSWIGDRYDPR